MKAHSWPKARHELRHWVKSTPVKSLISGPPIKSTCSEHLPEINYLAGCLAWYLNLKLWDVMLKVCTIGVTDCCIGSFLPGSELLGSWDDMRMKVEGLHGISAQIYYLLYSKKQS